ncbi:unnamed protein product [Oppiella nova]|uniref:Selenoprotein S n=1 Tax=Oppiella nova TaxID=334625 RepID=A0A7R9QRP3_9ACAR|nr:unnamed protein product [Oppiella nova]CAG2171856.1 unnamed protein product [Oppiella nova]
MAELKNKDPELITNTIAIVSRLFVNYGWYVLAVIIIGVIVYHKYLRPLWDQMAERRERMSEDPDASARRQEQMDAARRRQQEIYDKQRQEYERKEQEKQTERQRQRNEVINSVDNSADIANELRKRQMRPLRDNSFNPLMGSSSGASYRPSRPACGPSDGGG